MTDQIKTSLIVRIFDACYRHQNTIYHALLAICAGLLLADLTYEKHGHFEFENFFGFFAIYGFAAYCFIVLSAKGLRRIIKRDEKYYDH